MNTSLSWIKAYVPDLDVTAQEYTDAMTLSGTKVEGYEKLDADLDKIVIGQIDKIEKHPDADKLIICQVNVGTETIQIVTGAPNVKEVCSPCYFVFKFIIVFLKKFYSLCICHSCEIRRYYVVQSLQKSLVYE